MLLIMTKNFEHDGLGFDVFDEWPIDSDGNLKKKKN